MKSLPKILGVIVIAVVAALLAGLALFLEPDRPVESLTERWAQPPSQFVEVAGLRVHLRDEGPRDDAEPILLLHGTSASLHTWEGWVAALRGTRRVITVDIPGFGLTGPAADGDYSIAAYVRFVGAVLDTLGVQRAVVGGNSLGGQIAWEAAVAYPDRVSRLILVNAGGYAFTPEDMPIGFAIARTPVINKFMEWTLPRFMVEDSVHSVYGDPAKVDDALVDRYFELTLREGNRAALIERFREPLSGQSAALIPTIRVPTLVMWGGQDRLIPPAWAQRFHEDIAGSRLAMFDDLGHVPHEEDPARTVAAVQAFLAP